ncbi:putative folate-biopterin transporter 2 [Symbiodinium microadriaticum]|uniref:Putative folate-biopterin transporter 2 n=1 Tax=Symbiodinium microadriaticum TaxID=2951 RepID=A0A1Q9D8X4_SYMMI|nr:putative folate-biopterin transporter 2 [Symbiodinium microadriaticum]
MGAAVSLLEDRIRSGLLDSVFEHPKFRFRSSGMGAAVSLLEDRIRSGLLDSRLADIKQTKKTREMELALRIATTRERLLWVAAYYAFVGGVSLARSATLRWQGIRLHWDNAFLPLNITFFCMPPFLFTYQLDLALAPAELWGLKVGGKANRIAEEALAIREGRRHRWFSCPYLPEVDDATLWIHKPVCLPVVFEHAYHRERALSNKAREAKGLSPEPDWAYFQQRCCPFARPARCGLAGWLTMLRQEFGARLLFLLFAIQHLIKGLGATIGGRANPYLCKEYNVSAQDMQILKTLIFSPYILKPMLGLTSDLFPINGYNKAPYLLLATGAGVASAFVVGLAEMPLRMFVLCLFLVELMVCTDDLLTEAIYSRQMQDKPAHGQDLLTFVFAGMSFWSLLGSLVSGFLLTFLGAHAVYLLVAACALPALAAACTMEEPRKSASAVRTARAKIWRQKELFILALVMSGASVALSSVAALTTRPVVNAAVALLAALVVLGAFLLLLSPVIAKFAAFTLIQTSLHLSVSGPAFYFLTDSPEQYPEGPHFSKVFYNTCLGSVGSLATLLGLYTYNRYSAYFSYRTLLVVSNITFSVLHLADSLLFSRLNLALGIPDMAFAFGNQSLGPVVYQCDFDDWRHQKFVLKWILAKLYLVGWLLLSLQFVLRQTFAKLVVHMEMGTPLLELLTILGVQLVFYLFVVWLRLLKGVPLCLLPWVCLVLMCFRLVLKTMG